MSQAPAPGTRIAGKYEVEHLLGRGGMGMVVAARHLITGNRVAIKLLLPDGASSPSVVSRFVNEARAAVQIQSEHVARVIDVDTLPDGLPYMVMELLDGRDLSREIAQRASLPADVAVGYVLQALEAIAEAHALGIVHRDLKPANLFITRRRDGSPLIKVLDFGISKLNMPALDGASLTKTGSVLGSPFYMSPEQLTSAKGVDARSDIWSMGVVLYELLSGQLPFHDETLGGLVVKIATQPPIDIRKIAKVPDGLVHVLARCLEKDCSRRFATVAELAVALEPHGPPSGRLSVERVSRIIEDRPVASQPRPAGNETLDVLPAGAGTQSAWAPETATVHLPPRKSRRAVWIGVALAAVVLAGGGVALSSALSRRGETTVASGQVSASAVPSDSIIPAASAASPAPSVHPVEAPVASERPAEAPHPVAVRGPGPVKAEPAPKVPEPVAKPEPPAKPVEPPPKPPAPPAKKAGGPEDFGGK